MITDRLVTATVAAALERIKDQISQNIDTLGLRASGKTQASMHVEQTDHGGILWGRPYFQGLEKGSAPAPRGAWFRAVIKQWILDKGLTIDTRNYKTPEAALDSAAYLISRAIIRNGTVTFQQGGRKDVYTPAITEGVAELRKSLSVAVKRTIVEGISVGGNNFAVKSTER